MKIQKGKAKIEPSNIRMSFDPTVAKELGVEEAIMLSNIEYWTDFNKAREQDKPMQERFHYRQEKWWTFNSATEFAQLFPFWSNRQIERMLAKLKSNKYIESNNTFNTNKYDKTNWYSPIKMAYSPIHVNRGIDTRKSVNRFTQTREPIPDSKPDRINTDNKQVSNSEELPSKGIKSNNLLSEISEGENLENTMSKIDLKQKIMMWKEITPKYKDFFRNKTERANLEKLYDTFSEQQVDFVVKTLPITNALPARGTPESFFWKIFKPSELYRHWEQWVAEYGGKKKQFEQQASRVKHI